jgi:L-iditol 2-dehydrogenase
MGLLAAQILRAQGATVVVIGTAQDAVRLKAATELGFAAVSSGDLESVTPEGDFSVVAECSGTELGAATALRSARKAGRFVQIGLLGHPVAIELDLVCFKELQVTSGNASTPESWKRAERMVACGSVVLDGMVSASLPIAAWQEAFARTRSRDCVRLVLEPQVRS